MRLENGSDKGFNLAELLIVIACVAVLITICLPNFYNIRQTWILWNGARQVESSLQWGRMRAITSNTPVLFEVREDGREFAWVDPETGQSFENTVRYTGNDVSIVSSPKTPLRFYPRGNAVPAGTYKIEGKAGSYSVIVTPGGRIRFQKN